MRPISYGMRITRYYIHALHVLALRSPEILGERLVLGAVVAFAALIAALAAYAWLTAPGL
jgi:hypothetical protein